MSDSTSKADYSLLAALRASVELRTLGCAFDTGDGIIVSCRGMPGRAWWRRSEGAYYFMLSSRPGSARRAATIDAAVDYTIGLFLSCSPLRAPTVSDETLQMAGAS